MKILTSFRHSKQVLLGESGDASQNSALVNNVKILFVANSSAKRMFASVGSQRKTRLLRTIASHWRGRHATIQSRIAASEIHPTSNIGISNSSIIFNVSSFDLADY